MFTAIVQPSRQEIGTGLRLHSKHCCGCECRIYGLNSERTSECSSILYFRPDPGLVAVQRPEWASTGRDPEMPTTITPNLEIKTKSKKKAQSKGKPAVRAGTRSTKGTTKTSQIRKLIQRSNGASVVEMMKATGWQAHSVRGFFVRDFG